MTLFVNNVYLFKNANEVLNTKEFINIYHKTFVLPGDHFHVTYGKGKRYSVFCFEATSY